MNFSKRLATPLFAICLLCLIFPRMAHALTHGNNSFTVPQLLLFGLVLVWFLINHFKPKIMGLFKKNKEREK